MNKIVQYLLSVVVIVGATLLVNYLVCGKKTGFEQEKARGWSSSSRRPGTLPLEKNPRRGFGPLCSFLQPHFDRPRFHLFRVLKI